MDTALGDKKDTAESGFKRPDIFNLILIQLYLKQERLQ
jgi:hypothetical protein